MQTRLNFDDTFSSGIISEVYFWKLHICVEADFLPEGAPGQTTEESAAHHFLEKNMSKAEKCLSRSSWKKRWTFEFSAKMTPLAGQKLQISHGNVFQISI